MGFTKKWFSDKPAKEAMPKSPLDRRWADSGIQDQGTGIQCSSIAVAGAIEQWLSLNGKPTRIPWEALWKTQNEFSNLSAALTAAGMYGVNGWKIDQTPLFEPKTSEELTERVIAWLHTGHSIVCELRQSSGLNSDTHTHVRDGNIYNSWHAMAVSGIDKHHEIICKNSFGYGHGDKGYKFLEPSFMIQCGVKLYAITRVFRV